MYKEEYCTTFLSLAASTHPRVAFRLYLITCSETVNRHVAVR
jgi:hypothetical protein